MSCNHQEGKTGHPTDHAAAGQASPPSSSQEQQHLIRTDRHSRMTLEDGSLVEIRPVRPDDQAAFATLHTQLSDQTMRFRYFSIPPLNARIAPERLERICNPDPSEEIIEVAERSTSESGKELIGVGRLIRQNDPHVAEITLLVIDCWQRHNIGSHLLNTMIEIAKHEHLHRVFITFMPDNRIMRLLCDHRNFTVVQPQGSSLLSASLQLCWAD